MFKRVLIANRGEIAVRIVRACREMGITSICLYEASDRGSLHVRLADECVQLNSPAGFLNPEVIVHIAREKNADAIHPGYGFLAEEPEFIRACERAGISFIGPPAETVALLRNKINTLQRVAEAGFQTVTHSQQAFGPDDLETIPQIAKTFGYPVVIKSCRGGRGRGERIVGQPKQLAAAVRRAQAEAQAVYGHPQIYIEKAILPAHKLGVQVLGDTHGRLIHLGEREGSLIMGNQKIIEESPAPCLTPAQRAALWETALAIARLFEYRNAGTVEFLVDESGQFYFSEIKARLQVEHSLTEMVSQIDLVQEQIRLAAGDPLQYRQDDVRLRGWAMMCRIHAEDPAKRFLPSPGRLNRARFAGGAGRRVDTYVYSGADVPPAYDSLIATLTTRAETRERCLGRMRCTLEDTKLTGIPTNALLLRSLICSDELVRGTYTTEFEVEPCLRGIEPEQHFQDLAAIAAVLYLRRNQMFDPSTPERFTSGWHRATRRLPE